MDGLDNPNNGVNIFNHSSTNRPTASLLRRNNQPAPRVDNNNPPPNPAANSQHPRQAGPTSNNGRPFGGGAPNNSGISGVPVPQHPGPLRNNRS